MSFDPASLPCAAVAAVSASGLGSSLAFVQPSADSDAFPLLADLLVSFKDCSNCMSIRAHAAHQQGGSR